MNMRFRDAVAIVKEGLDSEGNQVILFKDSRVLSDAEVSLLGIDSDTSPIFGVKTIFREKALPKAASDSQDCEPEYIKGEEINASASQKSIAQSVFDALTR